MSEDNGHHIEADFTATPEVTLTLTPQELTWLVGKLQEVPIPSAQGKMLAASIQFKGEQVLQALGVEAE